MLASKMHLFFPGSDATITELQQVNEQFSEFYNKHDFKGVAENFYLEESKLMTHGRETITGREGIALSFSFWQ